jgi:hypothetical protein
MLAAINVVNYIARAKRLRRVSFRIGRSHSHAESASELASAREKRPTENGLRRQNHATFGLDARVDPRATLKASHERMTVMASIRWQAGTFDIKTPNGSKPVNGLLGGPFGIRQEPRRWQPVWTVTHLATGLRVTLGSGAGFVDLAHAKEFAERLLPLADWNAGGALADDEALSMKVVGIWNDVIARDVAAAQAQIYAAHRRQSGRGRAIRSGNR